MSLWLKNGSLASKNGVLVDCEVCPCPVCPADCATCDSTIEMTFTLFHYEGIDLDGTYTATLAPPSTACIWNGSHVQGNMALNFGIACVGGIWELEFGIADTSIGFIIDHGLIVTGDSGNCPPTGTFDGTSVDGKPFTIKIP